MITRKATEELLYDSMHELAEKKPIEKVTVKDIVKNCGMSSATFYRYFQDKYELFSWMHIKKMEKEIDALFKGKIDWRQVIVNMTTLLDEDKFFYRNVLKKKEAQNSFFSTTYIKAVEIFKENAEKMGFEVDKEFMFDLNFYIVGISLSITDRFFHEQDFSVGELADYLYKLRPDRLETFLR